MTQLPVQSFQSSLDVAVQALAGAGQNVAAEQQRKSQEKMQTQQLMAQANMQKAQIDAQMYSQQMAGQQKLAVIAAEGANYAQLNQSRERIATEDRASQERISSERSAVDREKIAMDEKMAERYQQIQMQQRKAEVAAGRAELKVYEQKQAELQGLAGEKHELEVAIAANDMIDRLASSSQNQKTEIIRQVGEQRARVMMTRGDMAEAAAMGVEMEMSKEMDESVMGYAGNAGTWALAASLDRGNMIPAAMPLAWVGEIFEGAFYGDNRPAGAGDVLRVPEALRDATVAATAVVSGAIDGLRRNGLLDGEASDVHNGKVKLVEAVVKAAKATDPSLVGDEGVEATHKEIAAALEEAAAKLGTEGVRAALDQIENADLIGQGVRAVKGGGGSTEMIERTMMKVSATRSVLNAAANAHGGVIADLDDPMAEPEFIFGEVMNSIAAGTPIEEQRAMFNRLTGDSMDAQQFHRMSLMIAEYKQNVHDKKWTKQRAMQEGARLAREQQQWKFEMENAERNLDRQMRAARLEALDQSLSAMMEQGSLGSPIN
jgi:hypothetical protein